MAQMSFLARVKTELCRLPPGKACCALAEGYGVFLYAHSFNAREIRLITEHAAFRARLPMMLAQGFGAAFDRFPDAAAVGKQTFTISRPETLATIAAAIGVDFDGTLAHGINFGVLEDSCCKTAFARGAFLAGGAVTNPERGYHLEFVTSHRRVNRGMFALLQEMGFAPKDITRKGNFIVYFKHSGMIEDILTRLGATQSALSLMGAKVEKDLRNAVQRRVNCDTANVDKSVAAAGIQLDAIHRIESKIGLNTLPEKLRQTAVLRLEHPEASLTQLANLATPPVTKSCMSHRLRKILEWGEQP